MPSKVEWGRDSYQASQGSSNRTLQVESKDQWVQGAYRIAVKPHDATQGRQEAGQAGRMDAVTNSTSYKLVNDFYDANTEAMTPRSRNIADDGVDPKAIEESLNNFQDTTRTLLKGLTALGQLHPFVAVAVGAFALVITMDIARRDNDRKVLAVKVQMQDLMSAIFELRRVPHPHERSSDGITIAERLEGLMYTIADDVKACGSACDTYLKKPFLAKTMKSGKYETRLADFGDKFVDHRKKLKLALSLHTAMVADATSHKLDDQGDRLRAIEEKLDMMALFRKLDTPREKDVQKFLDEHGGVKACLDSDELLEELVAKSGEASSRISGRDSGRRSNDLPDIRKKLRKELQEDIDDAFSRNMLLFERKLDIQSKQLTDVMQEESEHIISTLLSGAHDRITDPDLQKIWKDMGWKGSVKARHFVLALHDYYTENFRSSAGTDSPVPSSPLPSTLGHRKSMAPAPKKRQDDRWALAYINAAYVQPILEAVDDDGTGFVSVKEVNTFVAERPDEWTLPHWIAYWAVGWQASISRYKNKIYALVQLMFETLNHVLPSNRRAVDEYLFHPSFWRIELLLRSTRSVNPAIFSDPDLTKITDLYTNAEEERIELNLQDVAYELDTPATVSLITGVGRIERFVFPLIYLLLRRHLRVMEVACKHVLDPEELSSLNDSLVSILLAADYRVQNLEAIFKQTHLDVQSRLGNFAFGMFQLSYGDIKRVPSQNSYATWTDDEDSANTGKVEVSRDLIKASVSEATLKILKYGIKDGYQSTDYFEFEPERMRKVLNPIQGTWTGHCAQQHGDEQITSVIRISILVASNRKRIQGKGEDFNGAFEFEGVIGSSQTSVVEFSFAITNDKDGASRTCRGSLDAGRDVITAQWSSNKKTETGETVPNQTFDLRRTAPSLLRYRYTPHEFAEDPVRSRWAFACSAALHQAQERLWSRRFFEARFTERKRFVDLTTRSLIVSMGLTPQNPLNSSEQGELDYLRRELNPSEARFYQTLAEFEIQKLPWHPAWPCDWCERRITKSRIFCIHCMAEDLSDNIDLCVVCINKVPTKRGFTHEASHSLVKVEQTLHDYELARIVETAMSTADRIKGVFRTLESNHGKVVVEEDKPPTSKALSKEDNPEMVCACCRKDVLPPCWVCVVCTRDTFVCQECDTKQRPALQDGPSPGHLHSHALVRVRDTSIVGETISTEDILRGLEHRIVALEFKVAEGFSSLDSKVEERLTSLETKVEQRLTTLESNIEARFSTLEGLLQQIAAQTAALPAVYGTVVRDYARSSSIHKH